MHAQDLLLTFTPPNDDDTPSNTGPHKAPPRIDMPVVLYDHDTMTMRFEYSGQIDGATYYIKDSAGNICWFGILAFEGAPYKEIVIGSLYPGEYVLEIVKENYDVVAPFSL